MTHNVLRTVRRYKVDGDTRTDMTWELVSERKPRVKAPPTAAQVLSKIKPQAGPFAKGGPRLVKTPARTWTVESLHTFVGKHGGL